MLLGELFGMAQIIAPFAHCVCGTFASQHQLRATESFIVAIEIWS